MIQKVLLLILFIIITSTPAHAGERLPLAAGICVNKAQVMVKNGEIKRAVTLLEEFKSKLKGLKKKEIIKKGYNHYYIHFLLGNYYSMQQGLQKNSGEKKQTQDVFSQKAVKSFQACVLQNPGFSPAWLNLAKCQYDVNDFSMAATSFKRGYETALTPKPIHLYYSAICHFQANAFEKALTVFNRLIKTHPDKISLAWKETLVNILFSLERYGSALPHIEALAKESSPEKKKQWQEILLHQYLSLNMDKKALTYAGFLTQTDPLEPKWWKALSHIHLADNQTLKGLSALIIYGYLAPMTREELMLAADLYLSLNIPAKAALVYEDVLKKTIDPDTILKTSQAFAMAYDQDKAMAWIEKGLLSSRDINLIKMKAQILYTQKKYAKAADAYELMAKSPATKKPGEVLLMLGYSTMNIGQYERAKQAFEKAFKFKKQQNQAGQALAQIKAMETNPQTQAQ
jgi:tetratricopeptide (TPR) repeat protein